MITEVLKKPLVTEKMTKSGENLNSYGFIVDKSANKIAIKQAVEKMYNVTVNDVNTVTYLGKVRSRFTKAGAISGRKPGYKKAYVKLKNGDKIDFHSNV